MGLLDLTVEFDGNWVLTKRDEKELPVKRLSNTLDEEYKEAYSILSSSLTTLSAHIRTDERIDEIRKKIYRILEKMYPKDKIDQIIDITITGADGQSDALSDIDALIGWSEFKKLCHEIVQVAPQVKKNKTYEAFQFQNYLFSVNDGCGLTTALEKFYSLVTGLSLFDGKNGITEILLSEKKDDDRGMSVSDVLSLLYSEEAIGSLFCFDISDFMERSKYPLLKEFLTELLDYEKDYIFCFRIPFVEIGARTDILNLLSDVLYMRQVAVLPFTIDELEAHAVDMLKKYCYQGDADVWKVFESRIAQEKSDGKFYGLQTVDKVVWEILWLKNKADAMRELEVKSGNFNKKIEKNDSTEENPILNITQDEILDLAPTFSKKTMTGFDELAELIGMEKIADRLKEIVAQVKLSLANDKMDRPSIHMRFVGSPGTGKTTVARIVGKIFQENGILRNGYFFEYTARDLIGEYVGQTAPKTAAICRDAYGSVLFIDEAYALYWGDDRGSDYGREALTTLISEMENHRDDMVVIMAGYKDDMDQLMKGNAGLRSRMPFLLEFPSYTQEQLAQIFMLMVKKHFKYDNYLEDEVKNYFMNLPKDYIDSKEFSNARFARNLYERTWSKAALRMQLSDQGEVVLCVDDFKAACEEKEFSEKLERKKTIGFSTSEGK